MMGIDKSTSIIVNEGNEGERIDVFLAKYFKRISRSRIKGLIKENQVLMDGKPVSASQQIKKGAVIQVKDFRDKPFTVAPEYIPFKVVYYDDHIIVADKPSGLVVHPARKHLAGTLINGIIYRFGKLPETPIPGRPGVVHRLDRDTSGVMIVTRTEMAYENIKSQFKDHKVEKRYYAMTQGIPQSESGVITKGIKSSEAVYNRMMISEEGKESITEYEVIQSCGNYALLRIKPKTGRTHQIRLHLKSIGHPVLCDKLYGHEGTIRMSNITAVGERKDNPAILSRLALHAEYISFLHPETGERIEFSSPIPEEFTSFLAAVEEYM